MRLIITNALQDRRLEPTRRKYAGRMVRRPRIAGVPLRVGHQRILTRGDLTLEVLHELVYFRHIGLIRAHQVGVGGEVDLRDLRREMYGVESGGRELELVRNKSDGTRPERPERPETPVRGQTKVYVHVDEVQEPAAPVVEHPPIDTEPIIGEEPVLDELEELMEEPEKEPIVPPAAEPLDLDAVLDPVEEPEEPEEDTIEEFVLPDDMEARLNAPRIVTNEELRTMVAILGGKGAGKTKRQLIRDIMDALGQDDLDPVKGNQVLDMLKTAEAK